jgi:hypothetical protein
MIPKFKGMYSQLGMELPTYTRTVLPLFDTGSVIGWLFVLAGFGIPIYVGVTIDPKRRKALSLGMLAVLALLVVLVYAGLSVPLRNHVQTVVPE